MSPVRALSLCLVLACLGPARGADLDEEKLNLIPGRMKAFMDRSLISGAVTVTGTSILGLMMLAAGIGSELLLQAEGEDAPLALAALADLVGRGFDE